MSQKEKKNRKYGRWSKTPSNVAYKAENRRMKNKIRKVKKHLKRCPKDKQARGWLKENGWMKAA